MTLPTSYDDSALIAFMLGELGAVGTVLNLDLSSFDEAVNDVLLAYGVDDLADATDIAQLRALARLQAWRLALVAAASKYDVSDGTQSLKRSQLLGQIKAALALAETDASAYVDDGSSTVGRITVLYANDPYQRVGGP